VIALFTPAQLRAFDAQTIAGTASGAGRAGGVPSLELMERAAGHLARAVLATAGRAYGVRVALLCGKGNNGGDGLAAARRLLDAGAAPAVWLAAPPEQLSGDAAVQLARWRAAGGRVVASLDEALAYADVAVDCLLGTGATGPSRAPYDAAIAVCNAAGRTVVACDLPSGVDASTGAVAGAAVRADVTVTLGAHKRGLWLDPARAHCGRLILGELGLQRGGDGGVAHVLEPRDVARLLPPPAAHVDKRGRGSVVFVAGSRGMSGAATLVARGAMAGGAGLVTVATSAPERVAPTVPEALTVALPADDPDAAFARLEAPLAQADAVAVGPGLGHAPPTVALVRRLVREVDVPLVLDADGLNAFRGDGAALADHKTPLLTCTPHARELGRLLDAEPEAFWAERAERAPDWACGWDATLVVKGPGSVVAAPSGATWVNPTGSVALATGGSGDVLTGVLGAVLAAGASSERVAAAVWLHGRAGELVAARLGTRSATALDIAAAVPSALTELETRR
jgi:hydroxyethylthiazole kinase-like uncharacterized protein yjeF